jgi:hypothetical protein
MFTTARDCIERFHGRLSVASFMCVVLLTKYDGGPFREHRLTSVPN